MVGPKEPRGELRLGTFPRPRVVGFFYPRLYLVHSNPTIRRHKRNDLLEMIDSLRPERRGEDHWVAIRLGYGKSTVRAALKIGEGIAVHERWSSTDIRY